MNMYPQNRHIFSLLALSLTWVATVCLIFITFFSTVWKVDRDYNADRSKCILQNINLFSSGKSSDTGKWQHYESNLLSSNISIQVRVFDVQEEALFTYGKLLQSKHRFSRGNINVFRKDIVKELGTNISSLLYLTKKNSPIGKQLTYYVTTKTKFNVSSSVYEKLPQDSIPDRINRCAVVGNSGVLLNSNCGKYIDDSDFVYRCNAAPLGPFVADAGVKSNITSFNPTIFSQRYHKLSKEVNLKNFLGDMKQYNGLLWGACLSYDVFRKVCLKAMNRYNITSNTFVLGHPDHFKRISEFWKRRGYKDRPSTGFYYVTDALTRCNEIHLYGFWPFPLKFENSSFINAPYHYFDDMQFREKGSSHSMNNEFSILIQLHTLGVLKVHYGNCKHIDEHGNGK